jgi:hypothetical protein
MKTGKLLTIAVVVCWMVSLLAATGVQAQVTNPTPAATLEQEIAAIQNQGGFIQNISGLQAQGAIDGPTADSLIAAAWSIIDNVASLNVAADCHSITDLVSAVGATGLKQNEQSKLINELNLVAANISQALADMQAGQSQAAVQQQLQAIQLLGDVIARLDKFQQQGHIDEPTAAALETCALNLVTTVHVDLSSGLVAYYPFNGDANDASTNGNNGTVVGATFQTYGAGAKMALLFAGNSSSYDVVPRSASLEPPTAITISIWCYGVPGQACGDGYGTVLRKSEPCQAGYEIRGCNAGVSFQIDPANPCGGGGSEYAGFLPFTGTTWQHVVGTYSVASGVMTSYENGVPITQTPYSSPLAHSGDLYLGGANVDVGDGGFNGLINEVRIYNRALSATEVQQLYLSGVPTHP